MFGIKTRLVNQFTKIILHTALGKLSNDLAIKQLMNSFNADEYGHRANISKADLGYGWIHYGIIRHIKPKRIICIGSRHGYIPAILAQACKDNQKGFVDFVDPGYGADDKNHWTGVGYWKTPKGKNCFKNFNLNKWIKQYLMTSKEFSDKYDYKYDYIYIDGNHSYKGVKLDYDFLWPKLNTNGFIVFHDISVDMEKKEGAYGVHKLWEEIKDQSKIQFLFAGSGLGVIQKQ